MWNWLAKWCRIAKYGFAFERWYAEVRAEAMRVTGSQIYVQSMQASCWAKEFSRWGNRPGREAFYPDQVWPSDFRSS